MHVFSQDNLGTPFRARFTLQNTYKIRTWSFADFLLKSSHTYSLMKKELSLKHVTLTQAHTLIHRVVRCTRTNCPLEINPPAKLFHKNGGRAQDCLLPLQATTLD